MLLTEILNKNTEILNEDIILLEAVEDMKKAIVSALETETKGLTQTPTIASLAERIYLNYYNELSQKKTSDDRYYQDKDAFNLIKPDDFSDINKSQRYAAIVAKNKGVIISQLESVIKTKTQPGLTNDWILKTFEKEPVKDIQKDDGKQKRKPQYKGNKIYAIYQQWKNNKNIDLNKYVDIDLEIPSRKIDTVIRDGDLEHGIELKKDSKMVFRFASILEIRSLKGKQGEFAENKLVNDNDIDPSVEEFFLAFRKSLDKKAREIIIEKYNQQDAKLYSLINWNEKKSSELDVYKYPVNFAEYEGSGKHRWELAIEIGKAEKVGGIPMAGSSPRTGRPYNFEEDYKKMPDKNRALGFDKMFDSSKTDNDKRLGVISEYYRSFPFKNDFIFGKLENKTFSLNVSFGLKSLNEEAAKYSRVQELDFGEFVIRIENLGTKYYSIPVSKKSIDSDDVSGTEEPSFLPQMKESYVKTYSNFYNDKISYEEYKKEVNKLRDNYKTYKSCEGLFNLFDSIREDKGSKYFPEAATKFPSNVAEVLVALRKIRKNKRKEITVEKNSFKDAEEQYIELYSSYIYKKIDIKEYMKDVAKLGSKYKEKGGRFKTLHRIFTHKIIGRADVSELDKLVLNKTDVRREVYTLAKAVIGKKKPIANAMEKLEKIIRPIFNGNSDYILNSIEKAFETKDSPEGVLNVYDLKIKNLKKESSKLDTEGTIISELGRKIKSEKNKRNFGLFVKYLNNMIDSLPTASSVDTSEVSEEVINSFSLSIKELLLLKEGL